MKDSCGTEILDTDTVMITAYGYGARVVDTGVKSPVLRFTPSRAVVRDADGQHRAVSGTCLTVLRRDGLLGFEHNRRV